MTPTPSTCSEYINLVHGSATAQPARTGDDYLANFHHLYAPSTIQLCSSRRNTKRIIYINQASDRDLMNSLSRIEGLGSISISRIVSQRTDNGPFQGPDDFDRRVFRLTYQRLRGLCDASGFQISFQCDVTPSIPTTTRVPAKRKRAPVRYIDRQLLPSRTQSDDYEEYLDLPEIEIPSLIVSTWNAGEMSTGSSAFSKKLNNLLRFVEDSKVHLLCLQEVMEDVPEEICRHLRQHTELDWKFLKQDFGPNEMADASLAVIYRNDMVAVESSLERRLLPMSLAAAFARRPQVIFFRPQYNLDELYLLLNTHLSHRHPQNEIQLLAPLLRKLEQFTEKAISVKPMMITVGDFNLCSDSIAFDEMRRMGFVEMFRAPMSTAAPHPYETVQHFTTVGNKCYDNVWVQDTTRRRVKNAWCFEFGGRSRDLNTNAHRYAAVRKARTSDHLPLTVRMIMRM